MEPIAGNLSSLRPMKRPKEYYNANNYFIVRLPTYLRGSGEPEFHIGKDILNRSNRYADWGGNEVVSRMQKKYCFSPINAHLDMSVKISPFSYETMTPRFPTSSSCSTPNNFSCEKNQVNNSPYLISNVPSWPPQNRNNPCNLTASQMETTNKWPASQMAPTITPLTQYPNPVPIYNPSCFNGHNISDAQNASGTFSHNEKNKFNNDQNNVFCPRPQERGNSEPFTEFSGRRSSCNQRDAQSEFNHLNSSERKERPQSNQSDAQSEFEHLNSSERKERPQSNQRSKLVSSLQVYQNEKHLVAVLQSKNPRCVIFADLRSHNRFLHSLSQCLPSHVHVVAYFARVYKFPIFANAPLEQLIKTECFHMHPNANSRNAESQQYFISTINRTHRDLPQSVKFVLLTGSNPMINGTINYLQNSGRPIVAFLPDFDFSEFYSVLK